MFVKHIGIIIKAELERSIPLYELSKKKLPIFSPAPIKIGTIKNAMNSENTKDVVVLDEM